MKEQINASNHKRKRKALPAAPPPPTQDPEWSPQQHAIIKAVSTFLDAFVD
jgi:hypothetical protein